MNTQFVYLASGSPRRRDLLRQIGVPYRIVEIAVDEAVLPGEVAMNYVTRLAVAKAQAGWKKNPDAPVLAADTTVVLGGKILAKPCNRSDAAAMLRELSGQTHRVLTAIALSTSSGTLQRISCSEVVFRRINVAEADLYWDTTEPQDKAGGYAIQGYAAVFIESLRGSYSGVMGLPLFETAQLLDEVGVPRWQKT